MKSISNKLAPETGPFFLAESRRILRIQLHLGKGDLWEICGKNKTRRNGRLITH